MAYSLSTRAMAHRNDSWHMDFSLLLPVLALMSLGLIMVASASFSFADYKFDSQFMFVKRHIAYLFLGLGAGAAGFFVSPKIWEKYATLWLLIALALLLAVLIPGVGLNLNGSRRWLSVGGFTLQASEIAKGAAVVFFASQLARHRQTLESDWTQLAKLVAVAGLMALLLILEPDFGSVVVLTGTFLTLLFLGGAHLGQFALLLVSAIAALGIMLVAAPYRLARLTAYLDPWADQFNSGYQLTQSLIAFGRGEWTGVGLGQSVQKMLYLPDAHTDFVFAIYAEEFGFVGVLCLLALYSFLVFRIMRLSKKAIVLQQWYAAYVLIGFGLLLSGQTFFNLGVNSGFLPTKGLTLPFVSYGGSSLLVCCGMVGMMLRLAHELNRSKKTPSRISL